MSDAQRACGSCSACCTVIGVDELGKGAYETCRHVCETGCGIYADRPGPCRTFECQWLRGLLEVDGVVDPGLRPDVCGVFFDFQPHTPFGDVYTAWEFEPGASLIGQPKIIIEELSERFLVMVVSRSEEDGKGQGDRRFFGPPSLVSRVTDAMLSRGRGSRLCPEAIRTET